MLKAKHLFAMNERVDCDEQETTSREFPTSFLNPFMVLCWFMHALFFSTFMEHDRVEKKRNGIMMMMTMTANEEVSDDKRFWLVGWESSDRRAKKRFHLTNSEFAGAVSIYSNSSSSPSSLEWNVSMSLDSTNDQGDLNLINLNLLLLLLCFLRHDDESLSLERDEHELVAIQTTHIPSIRYLFFFLSI